MSRDYIKKDNNMISFFEILYEKKKRIKRFIPRYMYWKKRLIRPRGSKWVYIIGCPEYPNLGDNAIQLAMITFLQQYVALDKKRIVCITEHEFLSDSDVLQKCISRKSLLCGIGGGNMGNKYRSEELIRRKMFGLFSTNPIIIFPQTISYEGKNRILKEQESTAYYSECKDLTIVAREKKSKEKMESLYPSTKIMLTPDIVLSTLARDYGVFPKVRRGILFCTRSDSEKEIDDSVWNSLRNYVARLGYSYTNTDMYADTEIRIDTREDCVQRKMTEFISSELVITDRLHAMIFSALTETPCIVFSNNNHKIQGTYAWISYLAYIRYVSSYEEAVALLPELLKMQDNIYDNSPLRPCFEKLAEEVANKYNNSR